MELTTIQRLLQKTELADKPGLAAHVVVNASTWCAAAQPEWLAGTLMPALLTTGSAEQRGHGGLEIALARAVEPIGAGTRARLEDVSLSALRGDNARLAFAAWFAHYAARDRERLRDTFDRVLPSCSVADRDLILQLRALGARDADDLAGVISRAREYQRVLPTAELEALLGMGSSADPLEAPTVDRLSASEFRRFFAALSARVTLGEAGAVESVAELLRALAGAAAPSRRGALLSLLPRVDAAAVPYMVVEELGRCAEAGEETSWLTRIALRATLPRHLEEWSQAYLRLSRAAVGALLTRARNDGYARRFLLLCGELEPTVDDYAMLQAPAPRSPTVSRPGLRADADALRRALAAMDGSPAAELEALESPDYFVSEAGAARLSRRSPHEVTAIVGGWAASLDARRRERAAEHARWSGDPQSHADALRWDDAPFVREQALAIMRRARTRQAADLAVASLRAPVGSMPSWRAFEVLAMCGSSAHLRDAASAGDADCPVASIAIGVIASLDALEQAEAWWPAWSRVDERAMSSTRWKPFPCRAADGGIVELQAAELTAAGRRYRLVRPTHREHAFWAWLDDPRMSPPVDLVELASGGAARELSDFGRALDDSAVAARPQTLRVACGHVLLAEAPHRAVHSGMPPR